MGLPVLRYKGFITTFHLGTVWYLEKDKSRNKEHRERWLRAANSHHTTLSTMKASNVDKAIFTRLRRTT